MAKPREIECPICDADVSLDGDEKAGDEVYCASCGAPITIASITEDDEVEIEDEY